MYSEWASLKSSLQSEPYLSVLHRYPPDIGLKVANSIVKTISLDQASNLVDKVHVDWTLEVLCYSLTLPISERPTIEKAVDIYCDWLSELLVHKNSVPSPIRTNPNGYGQLLLKHCYNIFIPSNAREIISIDFQVEQCKKVLNVVHKISREAYKLEELTWRSVLTFLLAVCDNLLSPKPEERGVSVRLADELISVLFSSWLYACSTAFPCPPLWKTLLELCTNWRHQTRLIYHWNLTNRVLTFRLLQVVYGKHYPKLKVEEGNVKLIPPSMSEECLLQTWFRFLHTIGNPVDLSNVSVISRTDAFTRMALNSSKVFDTSTLPCLVHLPYNFYNAMVGVSELVYAFLGIQRPPPVYASYRRKVEPSTPPPSKRSAKMYSTSSVKVQKVHLPVNPVQVVAHTVIPSYSVSISNLPPIRPHCNFLLDLFGPWLFNAALGNHIDSYARDCQEQSPMDCQMNKDAYDDSVTNEQGKAEACGTLCCLVTQKRSDETISMEYLSRFYLVFNEGVKTCAPTIGKPTPDPFKYGYDHTANLVMFSIILNSSNLLRIELPGVNLLLPSVLSALEVVLPTENNPPVNSIDLRKAGLNLLLSCICIPSTYADTVLESMELNASTRLNRRDYASFANRINLLLLRCLRFETDPVNLHMVFGGVILAACDYSQSSSQLASAGGHGPPVNSISCDGVNSMFQDAARIVCLRLENKDWRRNVDVSLNALELLTVLSRLVIVQKGLQECKRIVSIVCKFIQYQCGRDSKEHSRDVHSMIVAAFNCLIYWLENHSDLLNDPDTFVTVMEVLELGISGSKSRARSPTFEGDSTIITKTKTAAFETDKYRRRNSKPTDNLILKGKKSMKPVSTRVRDAAEYVLSHIWNHVGEFPGPVGPSSLSTRLEEVSLSQYANLDDFHYFAIDGHIIVGIVQQQLGNDEHLLPTVVMVVRNCAGRQCWAGQLRHFSRSAEQYSRPLDQDRPIDVIDTCTSPSIHTKCFPDSVNGAPLVAAESKIPPICDYTLTNKSVSKLAELMSTQVDFERNTPADVNHSESLARKSPSPLSSPDPVEDFYSARMLLNHLGLLKTDNIRKVLPGNRQGVIMLDKSYSHFSKELEQLDMVPSRTPNCVPVFYVRRGLIHPASILAYSGLGNVEFYNLLTSLGWKLNVVPDWLSLPGNVTYAMFNFAELCNDFVFLVGECTSWQLDPSKEKRKSGTFDERRGTVGFHDGCTSPIQSKVVVIWLESYDDLESVSTSSLLSHFSGYATTSDTYTMNVTAIFVHPLKSGLFRVSVNMCSCMKSALPLPLVSGMVVSKQCLGVMVRHTVLNVLNRLKWETDLIHSPLVRRRHRIQDFIEKHKKPLEKASLLSALFSDL